MFPARASSSVKSIYIYLLGGLSLLAGSVLLLLIFGLTPYQQVQALGTITYHEGSYHHFRLALTPDRYLALRSGLLAVAVLSGGMLLALRGHWRVEVQELKREIREVLARLAATVRAFSATEKWLAGGLLLALLLVRLWYLVAYPISTDEAASFDYFIHEGPVAISSFYPIPNNHLLFSFLCWPLSLLSSNLHVVMRLPTLLAATLGTAGAYLLLTRQVGLRAATLGMGLFCFSPLGLYYAVAGRGYFLQLALLLAAFFAALALWRQTTSPRLGWAVFISSSILGLYTIPTFVYALVALGSGLAVGFVSRRRWPDVARLAVAALAIAATAALLYLPVIVVSGLPQLLGNRYVAGRTASFFWSHYPGYLHALADTLAGGEDLGLAAGGLVVVAAPLVWWRLPRHRALLALLSLLLAVPIGLMAVQQVLVPERVLLFMACFACLYLGVAAATLLTWVRVPGRWQTTLFLVLLAGYATAMLQRQLGPLRADQEQAQQMETSYRWLTEWGARRVFLLSPQHELFMHHFALLEARPIVLHTTPDATLNYDFVVLERGSTALPAWAQPPRYAQAYEDGFVVIYGRVPKP